MASEGEEGKITVSVRARPFNNREHTLKSLPCLDITGGTTVRIYPQGTPAPDAPEAERNRGHGFTFDHSYDPHVPQETVYRDIGLPVLLSSLKGFNTCIFAYGQTGSGKSYAMMGPQGGKDTSKDPGIIPRLCIDLFEKAAEMKQKNEEDRKEAESNGAAKHELTPELNVTIEVSYLEIYQEKVKCLINSSKDNLRVRQHSKLGVYVENLTEVAVTSYDGVLEILDAGNNSRHVASTNMNDRSSRSHAIVAVNLVQSRKSTTKEGLESVTELRSKINLVDLAGSERAKSTGAEGDTLREGAQINKSLSVLGLVISGLADQSKSGKQNFIPYRDSMLTWLLKESLGGNSKSFMLSTLSPAHVNYEESMSTLRYADRAKSIVTKAHINESAGDKKIRELEDELSHLRDFIKDMVSKQEKQAEVAKVVPKLNLGSVASPNKTKPKMPPVPMGRNGRGPASHQLPLITPRGAIDRVIEEEEGPGEEVEEEPEDLADAQEKLEHIQHVMQKMQQSEEERAAESTAVHTALKNVKTVKVARSDPYLMNVDNAGDWVMEYLVDDCTYLGTAELDEEVINTRCVIISGENVDDTIGKQHCMFVKNQNGTISLFPLPGYDTFVDTSDEPMTKDVVLTNGMHIQLGEEFIGFKFVDPAAPMMTSRKRRETLRGAQRAEVAAAINRPGTESPAIASPPPETTSPSPLRPAIPSLKLGLKKEQPPPSQPQREAHVNPNQGIGARPSKSPSVPQPTAVLRTPRVSFTAQSGPPEDRTTVFRHTFIFLGQSNSGKTAARMNLETADSFFSFFKKPKVPTTRPTFGTASTRIEAGTLGRAEVTFLELGGNEIFAPITQLLPERRVTFVLFFRLFEFADLQYFRKYLEFILCQSASSATTIVLLGTHADLVQKEEALAAVQEAERHVNSFLRMVQPADDRRPRVAGRFGVSNKTRVVISPSSRISKMGELALWCGDHAIHQCKADADFPHALVPTRLLTLERRLGELRAQGKWCITSSEYKGLAKVVDPRYERGLDELHRHTQLLHSWRSLLHHYRHQHMKKHIVIDVEWVTNIFAALSCCIPPSAAYVDADSNVTDDAGVSIRAGLMSETVSKYPELPFRPTDVRSTDPDGLISRGVFPLTSAMILFAATLSHKGYEPQDVEVILSLLENYDYVIRGSRLKLSSANLSAFATRSRSASTIVGADSSLMLDTADGGGDGGGDDDDEVHETFYLVPACFSEQAPATITTHLPELLFGPSYRFSLNMLPPFFFARFIARVSRYAQKVYLGPATSSQGGSQGHFDNAALWCDCAWVVSSSASRALVRMVHRSLFVTFHDHTEDDEFHEGLRHLVRCLVSESPGAECEEAVLCRPSLDQDSAEDLLWKAVDENLNSLEKIRDREQFALKSARGEVRRSAADADEDEFVPHRHTLDLPFDAAATLKTMTGSLMLTDDVLHRIEKSLRLIERGRGMDDRDRGILLEGHGIDHLVDALAQA